jgi:hypothetical protein
MNSMTQTRLQKSSSNDTDASSKEFQIVHKAVTGGSECLLKTERPSMIVAA